MGGLLAALRAEFEALEVQLAEDPRVRKAAIILELLEMYGAVPPSVTRDDPLPECQIRSLAVVKRTTSFHRIRTTIRTILGGKSSAELARTRLGEMAKSRWSSTPSEWIDRQANAAPTSIDNDVLQAPRGKVTNEDALEPKLAVS